MKYLSAKDTEWHNISEELPSTSTDVEFLDHNNNNNNNNNNIIPNGHICVEMSGVYLGFIRKNINIGGGKHN